MLDFNSVQKYFIDLKGKLNDDVTHLKTFLKFTYQLVYIQQTLQTNKKQKVVFIYKVSNQIIERITATKMK